MKKSFQFTSQQEFTQTNPTESKFIFSPLRLYKSVLYLFNCVVKKFEVKDRHMVLHVWKLPLNKFHTISFL